MFTFCRRSESSSGVHLDFLNGAETDGRAFMANRESGISRVILGDGFSETNVRDLRTEKAQSTRGNRPEGCA
jgi:hypothetical protein